jgi:hypothetical protein
MDPRLLHAQESLIVIGPKHRTTTSHDADLTKRQWNVRQARATQQRLLDAQEHLIGAHPMPQPITLHDADLIMRQWNGRQALARVRRTTVMCHWGTKYCHQRQLRQVLGVATTHVMAAAEGTNVGVVCLVVGSCSETPERGYIY